MRNMSMIEILKKIYSKPVYIAVNTAAAIAYYSLYTYLLSIQTHGVLVDIGLPPWYLVYLLVITSSVLLTIAVFSVKNSRNNQAALSASFTGSATAAFGGVLGGCGCTSPLLFGILAPIGLGSQYAIFDTFFVEYQVWLFAVFILINVGLAAYYLNRLSSPKCAVKRHTNGVKREKGRK
ncbi:conserved hypothetical protein, membrane [mine drainage metagenome]|uniref:Uncharacterized protein n=1 Tax=mine drainage metagenome TaxID=410659 RepID=T1AKQ5_9ZZZZ